MKALRWGATLFALTVIVGALNTACSRHYVIVPQPEDGYRATDTLYGRMTDEGDEIRVTFWFDTIWRVDSIVEVDTLWEEGSRTITQLDTVIRIDTLLRVDTVEVTNTVTAVDTLIQADTILTVDTVATTITDTLILADTVFSGDTIVRVDTLTLATTDTVVRTDTVIRTDTVVWTDTVTRTDTVVRTDTVARTDTVVRADTVVRTDTVQVAGQRLLFLPPGHFPPDGLCRVWVHGLPPGRQAKAGPCDALGPIPAGAFVLFGGDAWDFDHDWVRVAESDPDAVPPEIVALKRGGG